MSNLNIMQRVNSIKILTWLQFFFRYIILQLKNYAIINYYYNFNK